MGKLGKLLICTAALAALFAWTTNHQVPPGFQEPWKLKMVYTFIKAVIKIDAVVRNLGYDTIIDLTSDAPVPDDVMKEEDFMVNVRTVIYRPVGVSENLPAMVYYHGGGWIRGSPDVTHEFTADLVRDLGIVVISVDYRLAPHHPYPAPFNDCYEVAQYVVNNAKKLKVDAKRISLGGDSAGGNLAAAVATKFRDAGESSKVKALVLLYPTLQLFDFKMESYNSGNSALSSPTHMADIWIQYGLGQKNRKDLTRSIVESTHLTEEMRNNFIKLCGDSDLLTKSAAKRTDIQGFYQLKALLEDPYFSPLVAKDLTDMMPTVVVTVENDVLRDDGLLYIQRLKNDGVNVVHTNIQSVHGIFSVKSFFPSDYQYAYDAIISDIKKFVL